VARWRWQRSGDCGKPEEENRKLKQLVADLTLDKVMLQGARKGLNPAGLMLTCLYFYFSLYAKLSSFILSLQWTRQGM